VVQKTAGRFEHKEGDETQGGKTEPQGVTQPDASLPPTSGKWGKRTQCKEQHHANFVKQASKRLAQGGGKRIVGSQCVEGIGKRGCHTSSDGQRENGEKKC